MSDDLRAYIATFVRDKDIRRDPASDSYSYIVSLPFHDFNREIAEPGAIGDLPDGAVGIRVDDDFWIVATLPYRFRHVSCEEIVSVLWPWAMDADDYAIKPDSGDPYWDLLAAEAKRRVDELQGEEPRDD